MFETSIYCDKCGSGYSFPDIEPKYFMIKIVREKDGLLAKSIYALIVGNGTGGQVKRINNKLRDIVCPNEKQREELKRQAEKMIQESLINREVIRLVHKKGVLYISEPFQGFIGDCTSCEHFYDPGGITEGGDCLKHGISCGWGFTCRDNTSKYSVDILNKKKGCKND